MNIQESLIFKLNVILATCMRAMVKNLKVNKIRIKAQQCVNNLNKRFIDIKLYKHHQNTSLCSTQFLQYF